MYLRNFLLADQKSFVRWSLNSSLLFLPLEDEILCVLLWVHCPQMTTQNVYLLLENLDQSNNLNTDFVPGFIRWTDISYSWLFFWTLISIVPMLSWIDIVFTGSQSSTSVIAKVVALYASQMTQFADQWNKTKTNPRPLGKTVNIILKCIYSKVSYH